MTLFLSLLGLLQLNPLADAEPSPPLTLSIRSAVDYALAHNPDVEYRRERQEEGISAKKYSISQLFPVLGFNASGLVEKDAISTLGTALFGGDPYNKYTAQLTLVQPLYKEGLLSGLSYARKDQNIRDLELDVTARDLVVSIIQSFYSVFINKQVIVMLHEMESVEKESLNTAKNYYKIGRGQLIDVLQTKAQIALLDPQIVTAENQMKASVSQLTTLLHENQTQTLSLVGSLSVIDPEAVRSLLPKRKTLPEIKRGETQISQFEDQKDLTLSTYYPTLNLQGTFGKSATSRVEFFNDFSTGWTIGLYLNVPVFSGLSSIFEKRILDSQEKQLVLNQQKLLDTLSYNETQAERDLETAATVLNSSKLAASYAKDALKEASHDYKLQIISYLQYLSSQQNYVSSELSYIQAKGNYITVLAHYCASTGIPISDLIDLLESKKNDREEL